MSVIWADSFYRITVNDPTTVVKKTLRTGRALFVVDHMQVGFFPAFFVCYC